ncbi:PTS sugar transporter subunit IIC [candidate division KSB1 bacterium]|nr:PTS sugar transporter subunit IIC [candidate division KSB1 bacterium]
MWDDWLLVSIWGGMVALDTTAAMQILISHPLVSCSVVGLLLGNFPLGFFIGIVLELLWLNELPIGAAPFSEGNIGATVAAAVAVLLAEQTGRTATVVSVSLLAGVLVALIGGRMVLLMRHINTYAYDTLLSKSRLSAGPIVQSHYFCVAYMFLAGMILTFVSTALFHLGLGYLLRLLPPQVDVWMQPVIYAFLGVGSGVLIYIFFSRKNWWILCLGVAAGIALFFI